MFFLGSFFGLPLMPSIVLVSTTAVLLAADMPLPEEMTALGMVGLFMLWMIRRENRHEMRDDTITHERLEALEAEVEGLREEGSHQRSEKHYYINRFAGLRGTVLVTFRTAERCVCGAMEPLLPLLEQILTEEGERP